MNRRSLFTGVSVLLALIALGATCRAAEFDNVHDRIRQYIDKEGVPSISIAVVKGDKIVWEDGFGWADVENRVRATPHTAYMLGSVSKPITATVLMLLAEHKLVDLDRPANDYLGENKIRSRLGDASRVTVRQILQHTSGLPNYGETFYADESDRPRSVEFLVRQYGLTMIRQGRFHYLNLGYTLLGEIAARVTGKTFAELAKRELFAPLGMDQAFVPTHLQRPKGAALRYSTDGACLPVRAAADRAHCANNLKQIGLACHHYHDVNRAFPIQSSLQNIQVGGWVVRLSPFLEQDPFYQQWQANLRGNNPLQALQAQLKGGPKGLQATVIKPLVCPADALPDPPSAELFPAGLVAVFPDGIYSSLTTYGPNTGTRGWASFYDNPKVDDGVFLISLKPVRIAGITDGTSSTILFGEAYHRDPLWKTYSDQCMWPASENLDDISLMAAWYLPDNVARNASAPINWQLTPADVAGPFPGPWSPPCRDLQFKRLGAYGSGHGGGANVVMADGSVHFLRQDISLATLQSLSTRAGGEVITEEY